MASHVAAHPDSIILYKKCLLFIYFIFSILFVMMNKFVKTLIYRPCYKPRVHILIVKCTGIPCTINLTRKLMKQMCN